MLTFTYSVYSVALPSPEFGDSNIQTPNLIRHLTADGKLHTYVPSLATAGLFSLMLTATQKVDLEDFLAVADGQVISYALDGEDPESGTCIIENTVEFTELPIGRACGHRFSTSLQIHKVS